MLPALLLPLLGSPAVLEVRQEGAPRASVLLAELGCTACHASPEPALAPKPGPDLAGVGARRTAGYLEDFLAAPHLSKPGTTMPALLDLDLERARDLAQYLSSLGGPLEVPAEDVLYDAVERGRQLYHSVGCVACHAPFDEAWALAQPVWSFDDALAPPESARVLGFVEGASEDPLGHTVTLGNLHGATRIDALAAFLHDPLAVRPAGRMPSSNLTEDEARELATYLLFEDALSAGVEESRGRGLLYAYLEDSVADDGANLDALIPARKGVITDLAVLPEHRAEEFGFRYTGFVEAPVAGRYAFHTTSDDGSWLWVDGELLVSNGGLHAMGSATGERWLEAGVHALRVGFFERGGDEGLVVEWTPPGGEREVVPPVRLSHTSLRLPAGGAAPTLDAAGVARGRELFTTLGCLRCHAAPEEGLVDGSPTARPLAELAERDVAARGCLSAEPAGGLPRYTLAAADHLVLTEALAAPRAALVAAAGTLDADLQRLRCVACHRHGADGPAAERHAYFQVDTNADLGDEGRIPPDLDVVGAKLRPEWLAEVMETGARVRPYMRTRMPRFGDAHAARLTAELLAATPAEGEGWRPESSRARVVAGRRLTGTDGLGCIQCHDFAGHPSLGIPAVDLAKVAGRLQPAWFRRLLSDPAAINMNTRMPSFWLDGTSPVKDVLDGDPELQTEALWSYLELGDAMPLPVGLLAEEGDYELVIGDKAVMCGVFFDGVGPRTLVVGHPELVHYAYDMQRARLAKAWRGRFFNARGTWFGRAGSLEDAPSDDAVTFVGGPPIAALDVGANAPWPSAEPEELGLRILGRRFDALRRPRFRYALAGTEVEESLVPSADLGGLVRRIETRGPADAPRLFLRLASADAGGLRRAGEAWVVAGAPELRLEVRGAGVLRRVSAGREELLVPLPSSGAVEIELGW